MSLKLKDEDSTKRMKDMQEELKILHWGSSAI